MKTAPTDLDREAAQVFTPAPGMRAWSEFCRGRIQSTSAAPDGIVHATLAGEGAYEGLAFVVAFDTGDMPTVGEMLAQVEAAVPGAAVSIVDRLRSLQGETERRFMVIVEHDGTQTTATGPTRGAALVAVRRAVKGAP